TAIVKRDATNPVIGFEGRLSYFVDEDVAVRCNATDAMSGIATNTCANISGPAYTFSLGRNAFTARAVDNAGNESTASGEFTVSVSSQSVCRLVQRWVSDAGTAKIGRASCRERVE